jgi:hypothetical protein
MIHPNDPKIVKNQQAMIITWCSAAKLKIPLAASLYDARRRGLTLSLGLPKV